MSKICVKVGSPQEFTKGQTPKIQTHQPQPRLTKTFSLLTQHSISPIDDTKRVQNQTTDEWLAEYEEQWALECDELF